jgi:hypothetical protein
MVATSLDQLVGNMSLQQLAEFCGITVEDIVATVLGRKAKPGLKVVPTLVPTPRAPAPANATAKSAKSPKAAKRGGGRKGAVDTRSVAGREAYDAALLAFLRDRGGEVSAEELRSAVGGTATQARARLKVLIADGQATVSGQTRGTRYRAR